MSSASPGKQVWEAMHPNTGSNCASIQRGPGQPQRFAADTAAATGHENRKQVPESQRATPVTLEQIGLSKSESSRYQQLAAMPDAHFETAVATAKATAGEVTTAFMLREAKKTKPVARLKTLPAWSIILPHTPTAFAAWSRACPAPWIGSGRFALPDFLSPSPAAIRSFARTALRSPLGLSACRPRPRPWLLGHGLGRHLG
jgi:hypothetical protein